LRKLKQWSQLIEETVPKLCRHFYFRFFGEFLQFFFDFLVGFFRSLTCAKLGGCTSFKMKLIEQESIGGVKSNLALQMASREATRVDRQGKNVYGSLFLVLTLVAEAAVVSSRS
jgi:hypothetical protein